jgi:hypothetical protein
MARRTWEVRCLLVLALATPLLCLFAFGPPRDPIAPSPAGPEAKPRDLARARRDEAHAELQAFAERGERFSHLTVQDPNSGRHVVFVQSDVMLLMYVPCRHLDKPARDRLVAVLQERAPWHGAPSQLGDSLVAWLDDPDRAAEVLLRVFGEVYRAGPGYRLAYSGDR